MHPSPLVTAVGTAVGLSMASTANLEKGLVSLEADQAPTRLLLALGSAPSTQQALQVTQPRPAAWLRWATLPRLFCRPPQQSVGW